MRTDRYVMCLYTLGCTKKLSAVVISVCIASNENSQIAHVTQPRVSVLPALI